jgi:hypothetical protein
MITELIHITLVSITPIDTIQSPTTFLFPLEAIEKEPDRSPEPIEIPYDKIEEQEGTFYGEAIGGDLLIPDAFLLYQQLSRKTIQKKK